MTDYAIDIRDVAKVYKGKVHALRGIDLRVGRGEIFGLLGPNGAGKSTLVKILMTVIAPTRCAGHMLGAPVGDKHALARVGYLPEHHRFPDYLTGAQVLDFFGALSGVPRAVRRSRVPALLELVDMRQWASTKVKGYSKGMRQRVGVAQALMNDPELVLLDEPTDGVDPPGRRDIRTVLQRVRAQGTTVFVNSHILPELEMVCDRVALLRQGEVGFQGTIDELTHGQRRYDFRVDPPPGGAGGVGTGEPNSAIASAIPGRLEAVPVNAAPTDTGRVTSRIDPRLRLTHRGVLTTGEVVEVAPGGLVSVLTDDPAPVQRVIDALRAHGVVIRSVAPFRPSLEDLFMAAVTDPTTGQVAHIGAGPERPGAAKAGAR
ncbi:MAG TPA: ABC transporter [Phycisphaerales bacterium]|nr:ABC transporter [Phycisphaerales bacterium]